jgi:hypothetical protein
MAVMPFSASFLFILLNGTHVNGWRREVAYHMALQDYYVTENLQVTAIRAGRIRAKKRPACARDALNEK